VCTKQDVVSVKNTFYKVKRQTSVLSFDAGAHSVRVSAAKVGLQVLSGVI
jgi:hypothetical protein